MLTDDTGTEQTTYTYDPFGNPTTSGASDANTQQYTGRENDGTGLQYNRARYYSPTLQRFISEDPLGFGGGDANLYAYVGNDPINATDPTGQNRVLDIVKDGYQQATSPQAQLLADQVALLSSAGAAAIADYGFLLGCTTLVPVGCAVGYQLGKEAAAPLTTVAAVASFYSGAVTCLNADVELAKNNVEDLAGCFAVAVGVRVTATFVDPNLALAVNLGSYIFDRREYGNSLAGRKSSSNTLQPTLK